MSDEASSGANTKADEHDQLAAWQRATLNDATGLDFEAPIASSTTADCNDLSDEFRAAMQPPEKGAEPPDNPATRVFTMLSAVTGMLFKPQEKHEPFGPMVMFAYGRRSAIPEDFREPHSEVLAYMAERTKNPVLRARLCDICWLLDRKRGKLGDHAGANYRKHDSWLRACRAVSQYSVQCPVSG